MSDFDAHEHWITHADEWIQWARTAGHDAYWAYRGGFREFIPAPGRSTLEIGCGEGRISRDLGALGHRVVATDISDELLAAAEDLHSAQDYRVADAAALPFPDEHFDCVVAYNMLMDVPDVTAVVGEAARVLSPGGHFVMSIVHPFTDRIRFPNSQSDEINLPGGYFDTVRFSDASTRAGLTMHFAGWSRPLQHYTDALTAAGLAIVRLREPRPDDPSRRLRWHRLPLFLWVDAVRL